MGVHPQTVKRWIAAGKLSESDGLVRAGEFGHNFIDTEKVPPSEKAPLRLSIAMIQRAKAASAETHDDIS